MGVKQFVHMGTYSLAKDGSGVVGGVVPFGVVSNNRGELIGLNHYALEKLKIKEVDREVLELVRGQCV